VRDPEIGEIVPLSRRFDSWRALPYEERLAKGGHGIAPDILKALPRALADPVMIFESAMVEDALVVMTELMDENGAAVVVPIHLKKRVAFGSDAVNWLASVYGRTTLEGVPYDEWFVEQIEKKRALYHNRKKSSRWLGRRSAIIALQRHAANVNSILTSIPNDFALVKLREEENNRFYQAAAPAVPAGAGQAGGASAAPADVTIDDVRARVTQGSGAGQLLNYADFAAWARDRVRESKVDSVKRTVINSTTARRYEAQVVKLAGALSLAADDRKRLAILKEMRGFLRRCRR
jgi:hypothetical protein